MNIYKNSFIRKEFLKNNLKMFRSSKLFSDENTLIKKWKDHNRCSSFIDYEKLQVDIHLPEDTLNFNFSKFIDENRKHNYFEFRGRILFCRDLRNVIFGKIEVYVNKFIQFMVLKNESINLNDIKEIKTGNIVNIKGIKIKTKKETFAVMIDDLKIISKTEQHFPKPIQNQGLKSYDSRYNKRYLDLIINSENKEKLVKRSKIINQIRKFLIDLDFVEVETPILTQSKSGANSKTFDTHHDALKKDLHLRIAPEIYLKNLIISGFDRVFEIGKNFRNEDISVKHNPEFTSCELYATYWDYNDLFKFTLDLIYYSPLFHY